LHLHLFPQSLYYLEKGISGGGGRGGGNDI